MKVWIVVDDNGQVARVFLHQKAALDFEATDRMNYFVREWESDDEEETDAIYRNARTRARLSNQKNGCQVKSEVDHK
jgi:hypothetical protein